MNEFNDKSIDTELQVRLLNLVLDEASDFERDQLQQLMEQRPELVEYYQHLEHLHGLLSVIGGGQWQPSEDESQADASWTLPDAKRQQLLAVLDGNQPQSVSHTNSVVTKSRPWNVSLPWTATLLTVCASTILLGFLMWPAIYAARSVSTRLGASAAVDSEAAVAAVPSSGELYDADAVAAFRAPSRRSEVPLNRMSESGAASSPTEASSMERSAGHQLSFNEAPGRGFGMGSGGFGMGRADPSDMKDLLAAGVDGGVESADELSRSDLLSDRSEAVGAAKSWDNAVDVRRSAGHPGVGGMGMGGMGGMGGGMAGRGGMSRGGMGGSFGSNGASAPEIEKPSSSSDALAGQSAQDFSGGTRLGLDLKSTEDSNADGSLFQPPPSDAIRELERGTPDAATAGRQIERLYYVSPPRGESESPSDDSYFMDVDTPLAAKEGAAIAVPKLESVDWFADSPQEPTVNLVEELGKKADANFSTNVPAFGGFVDPKQQVELGIRLSRIVPSMIEEGRDASRPMAETMLGRSSLSGSVASSRGIESAPVVEKDKGIADRALAREIAEQSASEQPFSTFSLHVSDVAFKLAQESLNQGKIPAAESIRIEEFVNAMDYRDPLPSSDEKVACQVEQTIHPFLMQRNLLRVSMRTSASGRSSSTPLRLTLLLDNSGSMERPDRRQIVQRGLQTLVQQLSDSDQVTLISFASTPRLLADKVSGSLGQNLLQIVESLPSEGGTNIEAALRLAGEKALEQKSAGAQNRIVLMTDGAVNLGDADPNRLARMITELRDLGIAFDAAGISSQGLNDDVLEALTRRGDGRYYLLESVDSAGEDFSNQIAGALRPSARNVKVQVEFNPNRVGRYQLLGFETHRLKKEDFRNDAVDAAELSASEAGVAVYHFEVLPNGSGDIGNVSVRFQDLNTGEMVEQRWPILYSPSVPRLDAASPSLKMASVAALFAAKLQGGPLADVIDLEELSRVLSTLPQSEMNQPRAEQLRSMIEQAKGIL